MGRFSLIFSFSVVDNISYAGDRRARNLYKKNLAASRYDRRASFLYKFLARLSPALQYCHVWLLAKLCMHVGRIFPADDAV